MARELLAPGVTTQTVQSGSRPIRGVGTTTGVLVGLAMRGPVNVPTLITSWAQYVSIFAGGLTSPFMRDGDLAYAVYGFFQNGGRRTYILRVGNMRNTENLPSKARATIGSEQLVFAKDEGVWGNNLTVKITKTPDDAPVTEELFDIAVLHEGEQVEIWRGRSIVPDSRRYFERVNALSEYITFAGGDDKLTKGEYSLSGGSDGAPVADIDYLAALKTLDNLPDRNLLAIPGQTSRAVLRGILDWCAKDEKTFPILEMPLFLSAQQARLERQNLGAAPRGAIYSPWYTVPDPLSTNGEPRICPPSGHLMGIYVRTTFERGVHKAPAGVDAQVRGIVDVVQHISTTDTEILNPASVNAVMHRPNFGVVVWGVRTLSSDITQGYVTDQRLNIFIKQSLQEGTQWAVFEPNDSRLWGALRISCQEFLHTLWAVDGALMGATADEAFFVVCDASNNTQATIDTGAVFVDIGYAPVKPAEFVVLRIAHSMRTAE